MPWNLFAIFYYDMDTMGRILVQLHISWLNRYSAIWSCLSASTPIIVQVVPREVRVKVVKRELMDKDEALRQLKKHFSRAQLRMRLQANKHCTEKSFQASSEGTTYLPCYYRTWSIFLKLFMLVRSYIILCIDHWNIIIQILRYFKRTSGQGCTMKLKEISKSPSIVTLIRQDPSLTISTTCVFLGQNIISWKSK